MRAAAMGIALLVGVAPGGVSPRQLSDITSARIRVERVPVRTETVLVGNRRDAPIVLVQIQVLGSDDSGVVSQELDPTAPSTPGHGPILPHETRAIRLHTHAGAPATTARVTAVVFQDGFYEGTRSALSQVFANRDAVAEDLGWWIVALSGMHDAPDASTRTYLEARIEDRIRITSKDPSGTRGIVQGFLTGRHPPGWVFGAAKSLVPRLKAQLDVVTSHRRFLAERGLGTADDRSVVTPSVDARLEVGQGRDIVATLENLREIPLEAWSLAMVDRATRRETGGMATDMRMTLDESSTTGRILPHQTREVYRAPADGMHDAHGPDVRLTLAMWTDLTYEGSGAEHDRLVRGRQRTADELAFWIQALTDAAALQPADAVARLHDRHADFTRQHPGESDPTSGYLDALVRDAGQGPAVFRQSLERLRGVFDVERKRLLGQGG